MVESRPAAATTLAGHYGFHPPPQTRNDNFSDWTATTAWEVDGCNMPFMHEWRSPHAQLRPVQRIRCFERPGSSHTRSGNPDLAYTAVSKATSSKNSKSCNYRNAAPGINLSQRFIFRWRREDIGNRLIPAFSKHIFLYLSTSAWKKEAVSLKGSAESIR